MERLTNSEKEIPTLINNAEYWLQVYFKLKDIEDLEEQGLLLRLPCKVGDTIYFKSYRGAIVATMVTDILIDSENIIVCDEVTNQFSINNFGKTVFLTKAEAEQKLKEMESCKDNEG